MSDPCSPRPWRRRLALTIAPLLLVAACQSGDDTESGADEAAASSTTASTVQTESTPTSPTTDLAAGAVDPAEAGAESIDDPYVGSFGNGGYDVSHYDLQLDWDPTASRLDGITTITATTTQDLARFSLDLVGLEVAAVEVDGAAAGFDHVGSELAITPAATIPDGAEFSVVVTYGGVPEDLADASVSTPIASGWHTRSDFAYVAGEPISAATFHPVNDHPSDKAAFTFRITAPSDLTAVANGVLEDKVVNGDVTTWTYDQPEPQASYLTIILIGGFTVIDDGETASGIPIRNVIDDDLVNGATIAFARQREMIEYFETIFGPYPFEVYGAALIEDGFGGALETQTLSIFGQDIIGLANISEFVIAHEAAHQWFGNSVSIERWEDIWLNEGFASYAEALWRDHSNPNFTFEQWIGELALYGPDLARPVHAPPRSELFGVSVYQRGGLTLHALRLEVGDDTFFDILRAWNERYGGGNATTEDFENLAEELSDQELDDLFDTWLRTEGLPAELDGVTLGDGSPADSDVVTLDQIRQAAAVYAACLIEQDAGLPVNPVGAELEDLVAAIEQVMADSPAAHASCSSSLEPVGLADPTA